MHWFADLRSIISIRADRYFIRKSSNWSKIFIDKILDLCWCAAAIDGQPQIFTPPIGNILDCLRSLLASGDSAETDLPAHLPFTGGWLGWLGYELAWEIERLPLLGHDPLPFPIAYWYAPSCFAILDHWEQILYLVAATRAELDELVAKLDRAPTPPPDRNC